MTREQIDNGNPYVFCAHVGAVAGCVRGAGHNGDHLCVPDYDPSKGPILLAALAAPVAAEPPSLVALVQEWQEATVAYRAAGEAYQDAVDRKASVAAAGRVATAAYHRMTASEDALLAWTPAQAEPAAPPGWQSIETAPKDGTYLLLNSPAHGRVIGAHVSGDVWHLVGVGAITSESERPTHWMPQPQPPAALPASSPAAPEAGCEVIRAGHPGVRVTLTDHPLADDDGCPICVGGKGSPCARHFL